MCVLLLQALEQERVRGQEQALEQEQGRAQAQTLGPALAPEGLGVAAGAQAGLKVGAGVAMSGRLRFRRASRTCARLA